MNEEYRNVKSHAAFSAQVDLTACVKKNTIHDKKTQSRWLYGK